MPHQRKDTLIVLIACADDQGLSPLQIQKSLFLLAQSGLPGMPSPFYAFRPYNYGPFDADIYRDVDLLISEGLVAETHIAGQSWSKYTITVKGRAVASEMQNQMDNRLLSHLREIVEWIKPLSFTDILRVIYAKYPAFAVNSVFQD